MPKAKKPAKATRKAIAPPRELWMVWFHEEGWMLGSNDYEMACFATKELADEVASAIVESVGGKFTIVCVLPRKRAKGAKR